MCFKCFLQVTLFLHNAFRLAAVNSNYSDTFHILRTRPFHACGENTTKQKYEVLLFYCAGYFSFVWRLSIKAGMQYTTHVTNKQRAVAHYLELHLCALATDLLWGRLAQLVSISNSIIGTAVKMRLQSFDKFTFAMFFYLPLILTLYYLRKRKQLQHI